jgi:Tfp pilus assembly protein PilF
MDYLSLCLICKDENDYLTEWLDYHILMGVDRFYIYDNESQISLRETLKDYIERGWVVVLDIPGRSVQLFAYDHCLQTFGPFTQWMGFIDTDEFLVPKTCLDLKELLKGYEQYGGLAVSSLFFGSSGQKERPVSGQIAAYTLRTHDTFHGNMSMKSIVQPGRTSMPYSPHDFAYHSGYWGVNEGLLRVDSQDFPNHIEKIQLNHYFCRSESEIELKLRRRRGDSGASWSRTRFDVINRLATIQDRVIIQNLEKVFANADPDAIHNLGLPKSASLLEKMSILSGSRRREPLNSISSREIVFRPEVRALIELESQYKVLEEKGSQEDIKNWILRKIQIFPQRLTFYIDLAICYLNLNDPTNAWQALGQAWQIAPNSYSTLIGMTFYFLEVNNFEMAEKTCRLLLELAPHDMAALGFLTEALIGLGRWEEALKVGLPIVEVAATMSGELPQGMGVFLVNKLADHALEKKDYSTAVRLWEAGVKCEPGNLHAILELAQALIYAGDHSAARQRLAKARALAPQDERVLALLRQVASPFPQNASYKHKR